MKILSAMTNWVLLSVFLMPSCGSAAIDVYDSLMVRQILDKAGWTMVPVDSVVPKFAFAITAAGENRVSTLNLNYRAGLAPSPINDLPEEIGQLPELVSLSLSGNALTGLPASLSKLYKLSRLDLTSNRFTRLPEALRSGAVRNLLISHNQLDSLPGWIDSLVRLQSLTLVGNKLTALPANIAKLSGLSTLNLDSNQIASLPAELSLLTTLRVSVAGNRLCNVGDTLSAWLDKYHQAADWRTTQRCTIEFAAVVTDAMTGTVVHIPEGSQKLLSDCRPVQLSGVAASAVVPPDRQQVLKAVEVKYEECFAATGDYFVITIPWSDVRDRFYPDEVLSLYLVRGSSAEYLGGTVDSAKKTISVRSNRMGIYMLTVNESPTSIRSGIPRQMEATRIRLAGQILEATVTLTQPSPLQIRLLSLDGKTLHASVRHVSAGTTTLLIDNLPRLHGVCIAEIRCNEFRTRNIIRQY